MKLSERVLSESEIVRVRRCGIGFESRNVSGMYNSPGPPARRVRECRFRRRDSRSLARTGILSFSEFGAQLLYQYSFKFRTKFASLGSWLILRRSRRKVLEKVSSSCRMQSSRKFSR